MSSDKQLSNSGSLSSGMENSASTKTDIKIKIKPADISSDHEDKGSLNHGHEGTRYEEDSNRLLSLFPPEVWFHMCGFLDSIDFLNLVNSSLYFRQLFLQKRVQYLDKPVLEVLLANLEESSKNVSGDDEEYHEDIRRIILYSREVCKSWKSIIDQRACTDTDIPRNWNLVRYTLTKSFTFRESMEIDEFMHHFHASHPPNVNPFRGKYIDLHIRLMEEDFPQFCNSISVLLRTYGQHVVRIQISIMFGFDNPAEFHQKIVEWLNCMPNLQILSIFGFIPLRAGTEVQAQPELELPRLNSLKRLELEAFPAPVEDRSLPNWSWMERYNLKNLIPLHQNLESLTMTMFNKKDVEILEMVNLPLKTLKAQYHCKEDEVKLSEVFTMIYEKFPATLENLSVAFRVKNSTGHLKIMRDTFNSRLNLPQVKLFDIRMDTMFSLDFLLGMQDNLEELFIQCMLGPRGSNESWEFSSEEKIEVGFMERNQIIKFLGYELRMLESNIWNVFPKLKTITVMVSRELTKFERDDWIKKQTKGVVNVM